MKLHATVMIDHVTIYCKSNDIVNNVFKKLGFATPDDKHYMFTKNYLEGYAPGEGEHYDFFPSDAGLHSYIFWSDDPDASHKALTDNGYEMAMPPTDFARPAIIDGKEYTAKFRGAYLKTQIFPLGESALVRQVTPELVYVPGTLEQPNGVNAMEEFYMCIEDPALAGETKDCLERTSSLIQGAHPLHACVNDVTIASRADYEADFGVSVDPARSCVTGIRFSCRDLDAVRRAVEASGFAFHEKDGGLVADVTKELNLFFYFTA